jgi:hypothetical protein
MMLTSWSVSRQISSTIGSEGSITEKKCASARVKSSTCSRVSDAVDDQRTASPRQQRSGIE